MNKTKELVAAGHALAKELHCPESAALVRELATQLDVQLARSNALAAENAGLKAAIKEIVDSAEEAEYDGYFSFVVNPDAIHAGADLIESETPATDAFLAEVRASGVDMLAEHLSGMGISASETSVSDFAAQLRQEAK